VIEKETGVSQQTENVTDPGSRKEPSAPGGLMRLGTPGGTALGMIIKLVVLGLALGIAIWGAIPLIDAQNWIALGVLIVATLAMFYIYLSPRAIPAKYLFVGTIFLLGLQVAPVIYNITIAFTNFGDGHRGTKQDAIVAIEGASVTQAPGSDVYQLSVATDAGGALVFLLTDPTGAGFVGTAEGLTPLEPGSFTAGATGKITEADGYTVLNIGEASTRSAEITALSVPTEDGAIRSQGLSTAFEGIAGQNYEEACDCITDSATGVVYTADNEIGAFVDESGNRLAQGWQVSVGLKNFVDIFTNPTIAGSFFSILVWNFAFALLVPGITFALGLLLALVFNSEAMRGQRIYRSLLILPYAMPAFAMYLVWRDMFNRDFGLINQMLGLNIDWFGQPWSARAAVLIIQLWMGFPYMFLVCTGALQAIPSDLVEAAGVDGAKPFHAFRTITFPLLLVATGPLLITTFAFNFNNFNGIYLTSGGGPFPVDNPDAGATDLLISYTYRLAFGGSGANYGFAAAVSILIFLIVAVISIIGFKRTKVLEEIN
jgi:arabinogalactan oligomer/maltooligosaccharide transport system permease protein